MPGAAQTPVMFVQAGGANPLLLPECEKALAACGYQPDDFGSYNDVLGQCGEARRNIGELKAKPGSPPPPAASSNPNAHDRWLASAESGHIAENTRHQRVRGDNDTSYCALYEWQHAPCMPHSGKAGWRDTQHGAVTAADVNMSNAAGHGTSLGAQGERAATRKSIETALSWGMNDQPAAEQLRKRRFDAIAELNSQDPKIKAAKAKGDLAAQEAIKAKYEEEKKMAADCVEGFFEHQWRQMAHNTKDKRKAAKDGADAEKAAAESAIAKAKTPSERTAAQARLAQANAKQKEADDKWNEVKNLDPNDTNACLGQSRGARPRGESTKNAPNQKPLATAWP